MKGRKKWLITFFLILIFLSCGKKENKGNNGENGSNIGQTEDQMVTFKDKSIERIISDFEINSKKNKIDIDKFENLKYENQNFYMAESISKADSNYTILYNYCLLLKYSPPCKNSDFHILNFQIYQCQSCFFWNLFQNHLLFFLLTCP